MGYPVLWVDLGIVICLIFILRSQLLTIGRESKLRARIKKLEEK